MKIHHLIHALMILVTEHPEAKDYDLVFLSESGDYYPPEPCISKDKPHAIEL